MEFMNIEKFVEDLDARTEMKNRTPHGDGIPPQMQQQQQQPQEQQQQQESFINAPPTPMEMLARWQDWDSKQQQILRQTHNVENCHRAVFNPTYMFNPTTPPQLAPITDPDGLQAQIDKIESRFSGVSFADVDVAYRKNFLVTVETKTANLMTRTMQKCALYHRQSQEYISLKEYDAEIERLRREQKMAVALIGSCIGNKIGDAHGGGRETRKSSGERETCKSRGGRGKRRRIVSMADDTECDDSQES